MGLGPELIVNGDFSNGATSWNIAAGWSVNGTTETLDSDGTLSNGCTQDIGATPGKWYRVQYDVVTETDPYSRISIGGEVFTNNFGGVGSYTFDLECGAFNGLFYIRSNTFLGSVDNISVKEILPDTTTVRTTWIDSVSAGVTGNKIYRDDVEIGDVGMGVETFDDDTAEYGTTYKYEVQAYSATEETTNETLGVNVQNITTSEGASPYTIEGATYSGLSLAPTEVGGTLAEVDYVNGKLYLGSGGNGAFRYTLSDQDDISTAVYDTDTTLVGTYNSLMTMAADGANMVGANFNGTFYKIPIPTPYSLNSIVSQTNDNISGVVGTNNRGWCISSDGLKMFVLDSDTGILYQYSVDPAWVSTPIYDGVSIDLSANIGQGYGACLSPDDRLLLICDNTGDTIKQFSFGTVGDASTIVYDNIAIASQDAIPYGVCYNHDGSAIYLVGFNADDIFQYNL